MFLSRFYIIPFFRLRWITKTLYASAPDLALLSNFSTFCGPQVKEFSQVKYGCF